MWISNAGMVAGVDIVGFKNELQQPWKSLLTFEKQITPGLWMVPMYNGARCWFVI